MDDDAGAESAGIEYAAEAVVQLVGEGSDVPVEAVLTLDVEAAVGHGLASVEASPAPSLQGAKPSMTSV